MTGSGDLLDGLDPDQRQIAECLRGPVSVLAGAGTGKTRTITHRIAHGVRTGAYSPDRVLAVTFTRKAAAEMQARLRTLGAEGVRAQTFHGAALAQLGYFWPQIVGGTAPKVVAGKVPLVAQVAEGIGLRLAGESLRDVSAEIEWRKVSMLEFDRYAELFTGEAARQPPSGISVEQLLELQQGYTKMLEERRQIDFEDVLILMAGMLETEPRVALQVREQYRFFTVDEYQDVNPLQHALLRSWLGARDDVCVVGDASQTIYSFAGASSSYLLRFGSEYPNAREFRLERNYRSTPPIVRVANTLMRDRPGALTLRAMREDESQLAPVEWFSSEQDEAEAVASSVAASISGGTPASEIAVLYRTNAQSASVGLALQKRGIDSRTNGGQRFFDRADVREVVMLLRGQAKVTDDRPLFQIVSDVLWSRGWSIDAPEGAAARERWSALNAILALADEQPQGTTIQTFSEELLKRSRTHHEPTVDAVTLSAVHAAKGLEWKLVHLIGMSEGLMPISYASDEAAIDEERRLVYVAITRAKDHLRVSGTAGSARSHRQPSRFLAEAGIALSPLD